MHIVPKEIPNVFHNGSNYDYHFIMKESVEESEGQLTCLRENTNKYITFSVPIQKVLQELTKLEKKLQKQYPIDYNLLIAQDLCHAYYQILLIILPKEFIKLIVYTDTLIKNKKLSELNTKITTAFLNTQTLKMT